MKVETSIADCLKKEEDELPLKQENIKPQLKEEGPSKESKMKLSILKYERPKVTDLSRVKTDLSSNRKAYSKIGKTSASSGLDKLKEKPKVVEQTIP